MICKNTECGREYQKQTHNQIYCSSECCRIATNKRIKEKYHENKARLSGKDRHCSCGIKLSRYNKSNKCSACETKNVLETKNEIKRYLGVTVITTEKTYRPVYGD